jgi:hypothetical protein
MALPSRLWEIPEGLTVMPDGSWRIGGQDVVHLPTLRFLKSHLVFEGGAAHVADGPRRMPIDVQGPVFEATALVVDEAKGAARVVLDDGTEEAVQDDSIGMDAVTGRFQCTVRGGQAQAVLSRGAHQTLLAHVVEDVGRFYLQAGPRRFAVRA